MLADLIDNQGNLALEIDLRHAVLVDPGSVEVVEHACRQVRQRGGTLILNCVDAHVCLDFRTDLRSPGA